MNNNSTRAKAISRSCHRSCFTKNKRVLRHFAKFTGKHLCRSLFLNKVFWGIFKNTSLTEHDRTTASLLYVKKLLKILVKKGDTVSIKTIQKTWKYTFKYMSPLFIPYLLSQPIESTKSVLWKGSFVKFHQLYRKIHAIETFLR